MDLVENRIALNPTADRRFNMFLTIKLYALGSILKRNRSPLWGFVQSGWVSASLRMTLSPTRWVALLFVCWFGSRSFFLSCGKPNGSYPSCGWLECSPVWWMGKALVEHIAMHHSITCHRKAWWGHGTITFLCRRLYGCLRTIPFDLHNLLLFTILADLLICFSQLLKFLLMAKYLSLTITIYHRNPVIIEHTLFVGFRLFTKRFVLLPQLF